MINREEALKLVQEKVPNANLQKHCFAVEVAMRFLADELGQDKEKWALAGLLHDIDYTETGDNPEMHSLIAAKILEEIDVPEDVVYAVKVHNEIHNLPRKSLLDKALYAVDPLTGLIVACVLVSPEKKIEHIDTNFVLKRFKEKAFAKGASREQISKCEELGLDLEKFVGISLRAMKSIEKDLGF